MIWSSRLTPPRQKTVNWSVCIKDKQVFILADSLICFPLTQLQIET